MNDFSDIDPKNLFGDSYEIEGIQAEECRSIFLDWAISRPDEPPVEQALRRLLDHYGELHPTHPMTAILKSGITPTTRRKHGTRRGRRSR